VSKHLIPATVGAILLVFAVVLSVASTKSGEAQKVRVKTIVLKYKNLSDTALKNGDTIKAVKYAKLAIAADPNGKLGYACLSNAISSKYKSAAPATNATPASTATNANAPSASDSSSDLGC
jgi:Tfp pilus assembly protein PilF